MNVKDLLIAIASSGVELWFEGARLRFRAPRGALTPDQRALLSAHRDEVLDALRERAGASVQHAPLSFNQRSLWFLHQEAPESAAYNVAFATRVASPLDPVALEQALQALIDRHAVLRTTYDAADGVPLQRIAGWTPARLERHDVRALDDATLRARVARDYERPFDLRNGPVIRASLYTRGPDDHVFLVTVHHIAIDGWSLFLLLEEVSQLYAEMHGAPAAGLAPADRRYSDYAVWQARMLAGPDGERLWRYWSEKLAAPRAALELPADRARPPVKSFRGATHNTTFGAPLVEPLKRLAGDEGTTLFVVLLAAFKTLLHRYTGTEDVVVGTPTFGRGKAEHAAIVGDFVNPLPLRTEVTPDLSFRALLRRVKQTVLEGIEAQEFPLALLVERLHPTRDASRSPLFETFFALQRFDQFHRLEEFFVDGLSDATLELGALRLRPYPIEQQDGQFDLTLQMTEGVNALAGAFKYSTDLFELGTIERLAEHYRAVLEAIARDADVAIDAIPLLSDAESARLVTELNATVAPTDASAVVGCLVEAAAARRPAATAVRFRDRALTYAELNAGANRLARHLRAAGVRPGVRVGLCVARSVELVEAVLGVQKAGGAYVPLDPAFPVERLSYMLADSGVAVLVTAGGALAGLTVPDGVRVIDLARDVAAIAALDAANLPDAPSGDDPAYVIYTSGSTGRPKGVVVPQRALVNFLESMRREPGLVESDVFAAVTTLSFDIAALELFLPLIVGATIELVSREDSADGPALAARLAAANATVLQATPATWRLLLDAGWRGDGLRAFVGGDTLTRALADALLDRCGEVWNLYGPTETTVWSTLDRVAAGTGAVSVGRPIANTQIYVVDRRGHPTPIGVPGEIWIGGAGVALGYHGRPELTAERFIADPFSAAPGARVYRTGDVGRWRADGRLEHLGRLDDQVKIRGFRIEVGEIETALAAHPSVREVAVAARATAAGDLRLVAYVVPHPGLRAQLGELQRFLRTHLPEYMIPSALVSLEALPLTPNAKLDRRALPVPVEGAVDRAGHLAPLLTPTEHALAEIWRSILKVGEVGRHDDFFELGGHSLLATQVASRVREMFQLELRLSALFEARTLDVLARRIDADARERRDVPMAPRIRVVDTEGDTAPLSFSQERMWVIHELAPESSAYNMPVGVRLRGEFDPGLLARAIDEVRRRHETLRTTYHLVDGEPAQRVAPWAPQHVAVEDLRGFGDGAESEAMRRAAHDSRAPFDLSRGPVVRIRLFRLADDHHLFFLCFHHIAADQWSFGVIGRELAAVYDSLRAGLTPPLPVLPIRYRDFARWQRDWFRGPVLERQLEFWRERLAGLQPLDLPSDRPRPPVQTFAGAWHVEPFPADLTGRLERLSRAEGGTLFMATCAAFVALLHRYTGQTDIAVGVPIASRTQVDVEGLVGTFVNTLVLRVDCGGDPSFRELLRRVRSAALDAYAHQDLPFEKLVEELDLPRDASRAPLAQVLFNLQNAPMEGIEFAGIEWAPMLFDRGAAQFELSLSIDTEVGKTLVAEYNTDLFDAATVARIVAQYRRLLDFATASPETALGALPLLTPAERTRTLVEWNATETGDPIETTVASLIEATAAARPTAVAASHEGATITYGELDARANGLARYLRGLGVQPGTLVGVRLERSLDLLVALLGVQKAGGAYVPLDPSFPADRLAFMLADSGARVLLTDAPADDLPLDGVAVVELAAAAAARLSDAPIAQGAGPSDLAYVMYTSGSTGRPKGVRITQRALVNFLQSMRRAPGLAASDVLAAVTTLSFDIAALELYLPLIVGARIELVSRDASVDGAALLERLASSGATVMQATPATWRMLVEAGWTGAPGFRALCGGEALARELANELLVRASEVWNLYGPTETTVWSTIERVEAGTGPISIGRPIANTRIYVLDARREPLPAGVPGEIWIGGAGVADGYHGRAELTAERFLPDPFVGPGARMYRTGDRGRWLPDGRLEHLGRLDHQVKIRGFRIELGEIETVLDTHPSVRRVAVVPREAGPDDTRLVAYVVYEHGRDLSVSEVRRFLRRELPDYMVPSVIVTLGALPLTPNGKLDRAALPDPFQDGERRDRAVEPLAPGVEQLLADAWREILQVPAVGAHDNFFELGGHSLLSLRVTAAVEARTGWRLDPRTLFFQTLRQVAAGAPPGLAERKPTSE